MLRLQLLRLLHVPIIPRRMKDWRLEAERAGDSTNTNINQQQQEDYDAGDAAAGNTIQEVA